MAWSATEAEVKAMAIAIQDGLLISELSGSTGKHVIC